MHWSFNEHGHPSPCWMRSYAWKLVVQWRKLEEHFMLIFPQRDREKKLLFLKKSRLINSSFFACLDFSRFTDNLCDLNEWVHSLYYLDWGNRLIWNWTLTFPWEMEILVTLWKWLFWKNKQYYGSSHHRA